jgi:voltage-gated potassium channel
MAAGTLAFSYVEGSSLRDSAYFMIMIMTLIGASFQPLTTGGMLVASVVAIMSVGILLSFTTQVLGPVALDVYWRGLRARMVSRMKQHVVVCGFSDTAKVLLHRLPKEEVLFVVKERESMEHLGTEHGVAVVMGDYTTSEALRKAGVARARAVVAVSDDDAENAFVCLTAKKIAPGVPVIVTVSSEENKEKLDEVGADHVISPALLTADSILGALRSPASR